MNKNQDLYYGMFLTYENTVNLHEAALVKWPEVLAVRTLIAGKKGEITGLNQIQGRGAASETGFKTALREQLNADYALVVRAIEGNIMGDAKMEARYKTIMPSDLKSKRDTEVESAVLAVVADAKDMLAKLERNDVTDAKLEEMKVLAGNYNLAIAEKGTANDLAKQATADLEKVFGEVNEALRKVDLVIKSMPESMAAVRNALQAAREIKNA